MPRIVKFIDEKHNLNEAGDSIRLGTLEHYQSLPEEGGIGDYLEGLAGFKTSEDVTLTPETAQHMMPGLKKGVITVSGGGGIYKAVNNCYLFCATMFDDWYVDESIFPQYNSYYTINNFQKFAEFIGLLLRKSFTLNDVQEHSLHFLNRLPATEIRIDWRIDAHKVDYSREKALEISNPNSGELKNFVPVEYLRLFCKPKKYSNQREFRIAFRPFCANLGFLSVKPEPKNLSLNLKPEVQQWIG